MNTSKTVAVMLTLLSYGCADPGEESTRASAQSPTSEESAPEGPTAEEADEQPVETYQRLSSQLREEAGDYRTTVLADGIDTQQACQVVHDAYDERVRPDVSQMVDMSADMDGYMRMHGGSEVADLICVSASMLNELDWHRSHACASEDVDVNHDEVVRHVDAMLSFAEHVWDRCDQMMNGSEDDGWHFGPMMDACDEPDDCFDATEYDMPMMDDDDMPMMGGRGMHVEDCDE
jgi:hypothetical protein